MPWGLVIGLLLLFLLIALGIYLLHKNQSIQKPIGLEACTETPTRYKLPLTKDFEDGVYTSEITLGNDLGAVRFMVVPDTGSSVLIVSGPNCSDCPVEDGVWNPKFAIASDPSMQGDIKYGGDQRTTYTPTVARLLNPETGKGQEVRFGVINTTYSPDGRPMNVLGLQERPGGFLSSICGEKTVVFDFPRNTLYLGQYDDMLSSNQSNFISVFAMFHPSAGPQYPLAHITSMTIDGVSVPDNVRPVTAILDTGTTQTYTSPGLLPYLQGKDHTVTFTFAPAPGYPSVPVSFKSSRGSVESSNLPVASAIMIGNRWLQQYLVGFQHDKNQFVITD